MDLETAVTRLYEDPGLTEDLIDEEAGVLLKWAEGQLPALLAQYPDEAQFDEVFKALRAFTKNMNRFVGQRATMDPTEQAERLTKIAEAAGQMGFQLNPALLTGAAQAAQSAPMAATAVDAGELPAPEAASGVALLKSMLAQIAPTDGAGTAPTAVVPAGPDSTTVTPDLPDSPDATPPPAGHSTTLKDTFHD